MVAKTNNKNLFKHHSHISFKVEVEIKYYKEFVIV